jgi:hypothetical protein
MLIIMPGADLLGQTRSGLLTAHAVPGYTGKRCFGHPCGLLVIGLLLVFGVPAGVLAGTNVANGVGREISRMYVIDVRTESEWNAGHIAARS